MSEMQTLSIRQETPGTVKSIKKEFLGTGTHEKYKVQIIDDALKLKIIDWLSNEVRLLKPTADNSQLIANFP